MSTSKYIDKICIAGIALAVLILGLVTWAYNKGVVSVDTSIGYEDRLFDTEVVHTIDIVMDDWDSFIETATSETYSPCTVIVDGEAYSNVGIRGKGNTSLTNVSTMDSDRYSFKVEFDQYETGQTYYGLDKLCLNNLIQDNTMMKDYIAYTMMADFGVDAPLCSYVYITVNGEDWGLYLAVEGVDDSFLQRNYGSDSGDLYKPDTMSMGGGMGNGKDFNMDDIDFGDFDPSEMPDGPGPGNMPDGPGPENMPDGAGPGNMPDGFNPGNFDGEASVSENSSRGGFGGMGFGMGSDDVKLKYIDDDPDSYQNIFDSAKTTVSKTDQTRMINALKNLSEYTNLEETLDVDEVLRYFVVHTFVCNGDSYTGSMIHNYYLHESDGQLSMIPWDYNLAYGTFQAGDADSTINESIDYPVSESELDDRPMFGWILSDEKYTEMYHQLYDEFINRWYTSGKMQELIADTKELIAPYVQKDPTKFCTYEEFETGVDAISLYMELRSQAVIQQLNSGESTVDASALTLSDMGTMNTGNMGGGPGGGDPGGGPGGDMPDGIQGG